MSVESVKKEQMVSLGRASVSMPVLSGEPLAGYGVPRQAENDCEDLLIQAAVLEKNGKRWIFAEFDLLAVDDLLRKAVEAALKARGINYSGLILQAVHTHCSIGGLLDTDHGFLQGCGYFAGRPDLQRIERTAQKAAECIMKAAAALEPCCLLQAAGRAGNIASNRTLPADQQPEDNGKLYVIEAKGTKKNLFVFFACHPTVLGPACQNADADFPGAMRTQLQKAGWNHVFFINGACGDLFCRYTRRESTKEEAVRLGTMLADAVVEILDLYKKPFSTQGPDPVEYEIELQRAPVPDLSEAHQRYEEAKNALEQTSTADRNQIRALENELEAAVAMCLQAEKGDTQKTAVVSGLIWRWENQIFVTYPGELFSSLEDLLPEDCHILGYANGYLLYLPDRQAYENHIYEAETSPFACGEGEVFIERISEQIRELRKLS